MINLKFNHLLKAGTGVLILCLLSSLIIGLLAGFWGGFFVLTTQRISIPFIKSWDLSDKLPKREITIETRQEIKLSDEEYLVELADRLKIQVVKIFPATDVSSANVINQIYLDNQSIRRGFLLTNDGWVMTSGLTSGREKNYLVVTSESLTYKVEKIVVDPLTGVTFLKLVTENKNFPVVKFADETEINFGGKAFIFESFSNLRLSYLRDKKYREINEAADLVFSTEKLPGWLLLNDSFPKNLAGSAVFNLRGSIIGVLQSDQGAGQSASDQIATAVSANYLRQAIDQLLKFGTIRRPKLGLEYLDLAQTVGIANPKFKDKKDGALIYGSPKTNSPARLAGLRQTDLVLKVNNDLVNGRYGLADLIQGYLPGEVEITFERDGMEKTVKVKLGETRSSF